MDDFSSGLKDLLTVCADFMVISQITPLDLTALRPYFARRKGSTAIAAFLTEEVERLSGGEKTLRPAEAGLFDWRSGERVLYLAVCSMEDAPRMVTRRNQAICLYIVSPLNPGFFAG